MKRAAILLCAALALAACDDGKKYNDLTMEEKIAFEKCRGEFIASSKIIENKTGTVGGAIDGTLNAAQRLGELNQKAIKECAKQHNVSAKSVP
ncbi:MAG TPA: hypothetical protein VGD95_02620, partial [Micavibrio sp.]